MFIYPIYNHNLRNIITIYIYITRLASNEIFSPSNKIHREVGRAKDLSAPRQSQVLCTADLVRLQKSWQLCQWIIHSDRKWAEIHWWLLVIASRTIRSCLVYPTARLPHTNSPYALPHAIYRILSSFSSCDAWLHFLRYWERRWATLAFMMCLLALQKHPMQKF